jgi:hypothetical protein
VKASEALDRLLRLVMRGEGPAWRRAHLVEACRIFFVLVEERKGYFSKLSGDRLRLHPRRHLVRNGAARFPRSLAA